MTFQFTWCSTASTSTWLVHAVHYTAAFAAGLLVLITTPHRALLHRLSSTTPSSTLLTLSAPTWGLPSFSDIGVLNMLRVALNGAVRCIPDMPMVQKVHTLCLHRLRPSSTSTLWSRKFCTFCLHRLGLHGTYYCRATTNNAQITWSDACFIDIKYTTRMHTARGNIGCFVSSWLHRLWRRCIKVYCVELKHNVKLFPSTCITGIMLRSSFSDL